MNGFLDEALVGLLLVISAAYAFSALGPRHLRRQMLACLSAWLGRAPRAFRLRRAAQRIADAAEKKPGACGGCDNCGSEKPAPSIVAEIRVPIASIGRQAR